LGGIEPTTAAAATPAAATTDEGEKQQLFTWTGGRATVGAMLPRLRFRRRRRRRRLFGEQLVGCWHDAHRFTTYGTGTVPVPYLEVRQVNDHADTDITVRVKLSFVKE
jgi:hypothetical protein